MFILGGRCSEVFGNIRQMDVCDLFEAGSNLPESFRADPSFAKQAVNYREAVPVTTDTKGLPAEEFERANLAYQEEPPPDAEPWPPALTGEMDNVGTPYPNLDATTENNPDESPIHYDEPWQSPWNVPNVNPYPQEFESNLTPAYEIKIPPDEGDPTNWLGLSAPAPAQPSMEGEHGFNTNKLTPEWQYDIEASQNHPNVPDISILPSYDAPQFHEQEPRLATYVYQRPHVKDDTCKQWQGRVFNLNNIGSRPVPPSEGLGYSNTHPNCQCYWLEQKTTGKPVDKISQGEAKNIQSINRLIGQKSRHGTLHRIFPDGHLSQRTMFRNPLHEAISGLREQFVWLSPEYLSNASSYAQRAGGRILLVKASEATVTDHRSEGEQFRRRLAEDEMSKMARTAVGKGMDINHDPRFRTDSSDIVDSEYDDKTKSIQMIIHESDPEILSGIENQSISAVSINGGPPRSEDVGPCEDHCVNGCEMCSIPRGVVLGEADNIALTYVVTDPRGFLYRGNLIPPANPGVKTTKIEML
jgi:hypothetical protein